MDLFLKIVLKVKTSLIIRILESKQKYGGGVLFKQIESMRILVWFKNDLRLDDNPALRQACEDADELVLFYAFEEESYRENEIGVSKTGAFRAQFILECLADLQSRVEKYDQTLLVKFGKTVRLIEEIHHKWTLDAIYTAEEVTEEERSRIAELEQLEIPVKTFWQYSLYHLEDLPFSVEKTPPVFTEFRKKLEKYSEYRAPLESPKLVPAPSGLEPSQPIGLSDLGLQFQEQDRRAALRFEGGATEAEQRLQHYFWESHQVKDYKKTRNGLVGSDYSSKFSAWLAQGCISPRRIMAELKLFEKEIKKNSSTYWLYFELMWRDFFRFTALKEASSFFKVSKAHELKSLPHAFKRWQQGETGQDFVDANMKELLLTGFMSNRGRQNVASFLVKDLGVDWYAGALWFESQLIDYDVCSNYGNWAYVAGVGNDPRENRYFNVAGQAERYDPDRIFRKLWLE
jgi:deoxyribodipyrimidine photo-lyase